MVNEKGSEGKNIIGSFTENEIESFFSNFVRWDLLFKNVDIKSILRIDEGKEENRGFDFIYGLYEPFELNKHGIIIESKKVEGTELFDKTRLFKDMNSLKHRIQTARRSKELNNDEKVREHSINQFRYGILCYRFHKFYTEEYINTIKKYQVVETKRGNNFPVIFILTNDRLSAFAHLKRDIIQNNEVKFYYPYGEINRWMKREEKLSLFYLFSDIIPFEINDKKFLLSFDKPSYKSFEVMENFCGRYNHDISTIVLAKGDFSLIHTYSQYITDWEKRAKKEIKLECLDSDLNLSINLDGVFRNVP